MPRFLLQPLVENAIKHGRANKVGLLQLGISLERKGEHLHIQVCNTGELAADHTSSPSGVGYGLSGLDQRLRLHYGNQTNFSIRQYRSWVIASLFLPLR